MNWPGDNLDETIGRKAERREQARHEPRHTVWFGFGMFGLIGWAVAVPTLAGIAIGHWLDARYGGGPSWTVTGLAAGVLTGCINAWWWLGRTAGKNIGENKGEDDSGNNGKESG
jgi:ATP synthase protein I